MKKVLWTILALVLLVIAFVFYMKWFDTPLAELASNFVYKTEVIECDCGLSGEALDESEVLIKLEKLETHMNTLENLIEIQNTKNTSDQFDVIIPVEKVEVSAEPTEAELFAEFQTWREKNK
jgi:trehalose utilization protein